VNYEFNSSFVYNADSLYYNKCIPMQFRINKLHPNLFVPLTFAPLLYSNFIIRSTIYYKGLHPTIHNHPTVHKRPSIYMYQSQRTLNRTLSTNHLYLSLRCLRHDQSTASPSLCHHYIPPSLTMYNHRCLPLRCLRHCQATASLSLCDP